MKSTDMPANIDHSKVGIEGRDNLTPMIIHEIRNPLSSIVLSMHILRSEISNHDLLEYVDIIDRSSERINFLLKSLLGFQYLEEVEMPKMLVEQMLDEVLFQAADLLYLKRVNVNKIYDQRNCIIPFDSNPMILAISNIVVNAIAAMEPGMGVLSVSTSSQGRRYVIQIEDNGCGMSQDDLKNIFTPFFTKRVGGLGVGLAKTYDMLSSLQVLVEVESELLIGTRFILSFDDPSYSVPTILVHKL